jgi:hypothetical protein
MLIERMKVDGWAGAPIAVLEDSGDKYIPDGHHRTLAARLAGISVRYRTISVDQLGLFCYSTVKEVRLAHAEAGPNRIRHS